MDGVEPRNTAAEALLLVCVWGRGGKGGEVREGWKGEGRGVLACLKSTQLHQQLWHWNKCPCTPTVCPGLLFVHTRGKMFCLGVTVV